MINATGASPAPSTAPNSGVVPQVMPASAPTPILSTPTLGSTTSTTPPNTPSEPQKSNFTPKKSSPKIVFGGLFVILLIVGVVAVSMLVKNSQDNRNQAAEPYPSGTCSSSHSTYNSSTKTCQIYTK